MAVTGHELVHVYRQHWAKAYVKQYSAGEPWHAACRQQGGGIGMGNVARHRVPAKVLP